MQTRKRYEPSTVELVANSHYLDVLVLLDSVTRSGIGPRPHNCKNSRATRSRFAPDRESVKTPTFGTTSQTVQVPTSTTDDSSDDGVAARDRQLHPIHATKFPQTPRHGVSHLLPLGLERKEGRQHEDQKDSHWNSLRPKGQNVRFRSESN